MVVRSSRPALVPSVDGTGPQGLLRSLTLTRSTVTTQRTGLTQMWSLATEVVFYLLLPVFGWLLVAGRRPCRWILAGCAALGGLTVVWYVATRTVVTFDISSVFWLPNYLDWFAGGMALAVLAVWWETDRERSPAVLRTVAAAPGSCWVLADCLIAVTPVAGRDAGPAAAGRGPDEEPALPGRRAGAIAPCVLRPS